MSIHYDCYWPQTAYFAVLPRTGLPQKVDVVIVGGGLAGISTLYHILTTTHLTPVLLEQSDVGFRSSGRSMGRISLAPPNNCTYPSQYFDFVRRNNKMVEQTIVDEELKCNYQKFGGIKLATTSQEYDEFKSLKNYAVLTRREVSSLLPYKSFYGGLFTPDEASINPLNFINGLAEICQEYIVTNASVRTVYKKDDRLQVSVCDRGNISASHVVYCTNAYTPGLLPQFDTFMQSYKEQTLLTGALPERLADSFPKMNLACDSTGLYLRLHNDTLLVSHTDVGSDAPHHDGEIDREIHKKLWRFVERVLATSSVRPEYIWATTRCRTQDNLPLMGRVPGRRGEYVLAGFNGHELSTAFLGGHVIADCLVNRTVNLNGAHLFDPGRVK